MLQVYQLHENEEQLIHLLGKWCSVIDTPQNKEYFLLFL